jgi:peptidoglycan hydrolase-like protein with peptidoglycan-binding domain
MTHMHKILVAGLAALTFSAIAQTSTSGTTGTTTNSTTDSATSTTTTPQPNTMSSPTQNSSMNNVPSTGTTGATTSTTSTATTTRDPAMIREVQQALIDKGISTGGAVDGMWGSRSASALREFQRQQGMAVTGSLDSATLSALGVSSGSSGFSPGTTTDDTAPGMPARQGRSPSDVIDDTAPMDNTTPGTGRSPSEDQR